MDDLRSLATSATYRPPRNAAEDLMDGPMEDRPAKMKALMDDLRTYRPDARQAAQPPRTTTTEGVGATGAAGPVSPSLLRAAASILWADERPCDVEAMCAGLVTVSEANQRGHWAKGAGRAHQQRKTAFRALWELDGEGPAGPLVIILTRFGPRALDSDNLARGLKAVRDGVADWLGRDDGHESLTWHYQQHKGKPGVRIQMWRWEP